MPTLLGDLRLGLRTLLRTPGFTATAVLVFALGIGLNTGLFAVINAMLLKPFGGPADGELVGVYERERATPDSYRRFSYRDYLLVRDHPGALSSVLAQALGTVGVTEGGLSRRHVVALVSANYFSTLAAAPALGREFRSDEESLETAAVTIVSDGYWRRHGADRSLAGRTVRINGRDFTVVGVAPAGFSGASAMLAPDFYLPLGACAVVDGPGATGQPTPSLWSDERRELTLIGRLRPGVSRVAAAASLAGPAAALTPAEGRPGASRELVVAGVSRFSIGASPSGDAEITQAMVFLAGLALSVLLIASVNLANMLLARGTARTREVAVRLAVGGSRWRIVRMLIAETTWLALAGACLGLAASVALTALLSRAVVGFMPFGLVFDATPDVRVLAATLGFASVGGLVCGLGPALGLARGASLSHLKDQAGQIPGAASRMSIRNALVVVQLAVSLGLLTVAATFVRSAIVIANADAGFPLDGGLVASVSPESSGYGEVQGRQAYSKVAERLRGLPGIGAVSLSSESPSGVDSEATMVRDAAAGAGVEPRVALVSVIGADHFKTLGRPVVRGREFTAAEERGPRAPQPVVVSQALAARLWPGADPLGRRLQMEDERSGWTPPLEVVGVVRSVRKAFDREPPGRLYLPLGGAYRGQMQIHVRLRSTDPAATSAMIGAVRHALRDADPGLAILDVDTLRRHRDRSPYLLVARGSAALFTGFGAAALLVAALGVFGVKSYLVSQRRKEIAIRMALGADEPDVLRLVLGDGLAITAGGLACGVALAAALSKVLAAWVAGGRGLDPFPVGAAAVVLFAVALCASYIPIRRVTRRQPWSALRAD